MPRKVEKHDAHEKRPERPVVYHVPQCLPENRQARFFIQLFVPPGRARNAPQHKRLQQHAHPCQGVENLQHLQFFFHMGGGGHQRAAKERYDHADKEQAPVAHGQNAVALGHIHRVAKKVLPLGVINPNTPYRHAQKGKERFHAPRREPRHGGIAKVGNPEKEKQEKGHRAAAAGAAAE